MGKGSISAMEKYADILNKGDGVPINKSETFRLFQIAIEKGDPNSMFNSAMILKKGYGIQSNMQEVIKCIKMTADSGNTD